MGKRKLGEVELVTPDVVDQPKQAKVQEQPPFLSEKRRVTNAFSYANRIIFR